MKCTPHLQRIGIVSGNGWVALASSELMGDFRVTAQGSAVSIRLDGAGPGIVMTANQAMDFRSIDLSRLSISTTSGTMVFVIITGNTPPGPPGV